MKVLNYLICTAIEGSSQIWINVQKNKGLLPGFTDRLSELQHDSYINLALFVKTNYFILN